MARDRIRLGISSCLLGQRVRYDGRHKLDLALIESLSPFVVWVPVCPEAEAGFGTPREPMHLISRQGHLRLVTIDTHLDRTADLARFACRRLDGLSNEQLSGYVLKSDSPSCGLKRVKVYDARGKVTPTGQGLFASALRARYPLLPVEEDTRLSDPDGREHFIERAVAYRQLRALFARRWTIAALVRFHTAHTLSLLAHDETAYRALGRLVAGAQSSPRASVAARYSERFMAALERPANRRRHVNVLQHMAGYLRPILSGNEKAGLAATIEAYRRGRVPLGMPIAVLHRHAQRHRASYLLGQSYLELHVTLGKVRTQ